MNNSLQPLKTSSLTNMEFGQLMKRHLIDLSSIDQALLNDQPYNAYLQQLNEKLEIYEKGLARVLENEETELISLADKGRDRAVVAFSKVLKLFAVSENADEVEASRKLGILFHTFKRRRSGCGRKRRSRSCCCPAARAPRHRSSGRQTGGPFPPLPPRRASPTF